MLPPCGGGPSVGRANHVKIQKEPHDKQAFGATVGATIAAFLSNNIVSRLNFIDMLPSIGKLKGFHSIDCFDSDQQQRPPNPVVGVVVGKFYLSFAHDEGNVVQSRASLFISCEFLAYI